MFQFQRIEEVPENFDDYVAEISTGIEQLYGLRAAEAYSRMAHDAWRATLEHVFVNAWRAYEGETTAGLLLSTLRSRIGQISFIHVLHRFEGRGLEQQLVEKSVQWMRELGAQSIVSEYVPFCALALDDTFRNLGFDHIKRAVMEAPLTAPGLLPANGTSVVADEFKFAALANVIVDAYVDHPAFANALIGRVIESAGFKVAIVPQPNWRDDLRDFRKFGKPRLCFAVSAGNMDSMVNHYTANKRLRSDEIGRAHV